MLLHISNIGADAIAAFEHGGTNAVAPFEHRGLWGPMLLHFSNIGGCGDQCYCTFRTSGPGGPMLLHFSNIGGCGDQCYCTFRTSGAVGTNAIAHFEHRGLWGPMLLHFSNIGGCGDQCCCTFRTSGAVGTNFRTSGALRTNAVALFEHRGLWGPMLLHISNIGGCGDQCHCTFRTSGAVATNAIAHFEHRGLRGPMLLHISNIGADAIAAFEHGGPMLLHISNIGGCGDQCYCTVRASGAVGTIPIELEVSQCCPCDVNKAKGSIASDILCGQVLRATRLGVVKRSANDNMKS